MSNTSGVGGQVRDVESRGSSSRRLIDRWLTGYATTEQSLGLYRIAFALWTLLWVEPAVEFAAVLQLPSGFFLPPPGPARWVADLAGATSFPGPVFFGVFTSALNFSLLCLAAGWRTPWAAVSTNVLLLVGSAIQFSSGKVNHSLLFVLTPLVLAWSGWGNCYSLDALRGRRVPLRPACLSVLAALLAFAMFTAAVQKVQWLNPGKVASYGHLLRHVLAYGRADLLGPAAVTWSSPLFWKAVDYAVVCFEASFLATLFFPRWFRYCVAGAIAFHSITAALFNIAFLVHHGVYLAFLNGAALLPNGRPRPGAARVVTGVAAVPAVVAVADARGADVAALPASREPRARPLSASLRLLRATLHGPGAVLLLGGAALAIGAWGSPLRLVDGLLGFRSDLRERELLSLFLGWGVLAATARAKWRARGPGRAGAGEGRRPRLVICRAAGISSRFFPTETRGRPPRVGAMPVPTPSGPCTDSGDVGGERGHGDARVR